jgi:aminopeptidase N
MVTVYATSGGANEWAFVYGAYDKAAPQAKFNMIRGSFPAMIGHIDNEADALQGISALKDFGVKFKQFGIAPVVVGALNDVKTQRTNMKDDAGAKAADDAIKAINDAK